MDTPSTDKLIIRIIHNDCVKVSSEYNILPSVVAAIGLSISDCGRLSLCNRTRNLYLLPVTDDYYGACYSSTSNTEYKSAKDCTEIGANLYRMYSTPQESVKSFVVELMTSRRGNNGPLRYASLVGCTDYTECINRLIRAGFIESYLNRGFDTTYSGKLLNLIENYKLYEWDEEIKEDNSMSKKRRHIHINKPESVEEITTEEVVEESVDDTSEAVEIEESAEEEEQVTADKFHMYRVRLDWDRPDTQIFASPNYEDARFECLKHEGYKIYIDDDGELFSDPWEGIYELAEAQKTSYESENVKKVVHPIPGASIVLNNAPIYRKAIDKFSYCYLTGEFYFYDNIVVNGRAKITKVKSSKNLTDPKLILGYVNI